MVNYDFGPAASVPRARTSQSSRRPEASHPFVHSSDYLALLIPSRAALNNPVHQWHLKADVDAGFFALSIHLWHKISALSAKNALYKDEFLTRWVASTMGACLLAIPSRN
jgi:hypothetical protein